MPAAARTERNAAPAGGAWIVSRRVDLAMCVAPLVWAVLAVPLFAGVHGGDIPLGAFVLRQQLRSERSVWWAARRRSRRRRALRAAASTSTSSPSAIV